MSRQKDIYDLFTLKNNIKLSKEALNLLIPSDLNIKDILRDYKLISKSEYIDLDILKNIISNKYSLVPYNYEYISLMTHYSFLRGKYQDLTDIAHIKNGHFIFGFVYINKDNDKVIEDKSGCIKVKGVKYTDIFMRLQGVKKDDYFVCSQDTNSHAINSATRQISNSHAINNPFPISLVIYNSVYKESDFDTSIILNSNTKSVKYRINDIIPRILNINNIKITIYNRNIISDIKDIPVYLENYNYNFMTQPNLFYKEDYDLFVVTSTNINHVEMYKGKVFVILKKGSRLEIKGDAIEIL